MMRRSNRMTMACIVGMSALVLSSAWAAPAVTLTAQASKGEYAPGEQPELTLTLGLAASDPAPVTVCPRATGVVRVVRLTRNGVRIAPRRSVIFFGEDPALIQERSLRTLAPGQTVTISYAASPGMSNPKFMDARVTSRPRRPYKVFVYDFPGAGQYDLQLSYDYNGPDGGRADVLRSRVLSNVVTFRML